MHLPSGSIFSNWPSSKNNLQNVTAVDFSLSSNYLACGNNKGKVLVFRFVEVFVVVGLISSNRV